MMKIFSKEIHFATLIKRRLYLQKALAYFIVTNSRFREIKFPSVVSQHRNACMALLPACLPIQSE